METLYTIGFTKKNAKAFFELLSESKVNIVLDIRLNNTSQLAGFSKYPDIEYFLSHLCCIDYVHDISFTPERETLEAYKKNEINWVEYVKQFRATMDSRKILEYIKKNYEFINNKTVCLLCSELKADKCHRSLVAEYFTETYNDLKVVHL